MRGTKAITVADALKAFPKDSTVAEGLRLVASMPEPPPRDEVADARVSAKDQRERTLRAWCTGLGIPFTDAMLLLGGEVVDTPALIAARKLREQAQYGAIACLSGPNGVGKSFAASWLVSQGPPRPYPYGGDWPEDLRPRFVSAGQLQRLSLFGDDADWRAVAHASVLAIDELGTEYNDKTGAFASRFDQLIAWREKGPCWTIITTNLTLRDRAPDKNTPATPPPTDSFLGRYGERVHDRLRRPGSGYLHLTGASLRQPSAKKPTR